MVLPVPCHFIGIFGQYQDLGLEAKDGRFVRTEEKLGAEVAHRGAKRRLRRSVPAGQRQ